MLIKLLEVGARGWGASGSRFPRLDLPPRSREFVSVRMIIHSYPLEEAKRRGEFLLCNKFGLARQLLRPAITGDSLRLKERGGQPPRSAIKVGQGDTPLAVQVGNTINMIFV